MTVEVIPNFGPVAYVGLSSDSKPTDTSVGSTFYETDTGAKYMFSGAAWGTDLRGGTELHVRKSATFAGGAGTGNAGTFAVFTITGRVWVNGISAFCTDSLTTSGAATISLGDAGDVDGFIVSTTATDIDVNEWWGTAVPAASSYNPIDITGTPAAPNGGYATAQINKWLSANVIFTIGTANILTGTVIVDLWYKPITDNGRLVAA